MDVDADVSEAVVGLLSSTRRHALVVDAIKATMLEGRIVMGFKGLYFIFAFLFAYHSENALFFNGVPVDPDNVMTAKCCLVKKSVKSIIRTQVC